MPHVSLSKGMASSPKNKGISPTGNWTLSFFFSFFFYFCRANSTKSQHNRLCCHAIANREKSFCMTALIYKTTTTAGKAYKEMDFESCNLCNLFEISVLTLIKGMIVSIMFFRTREKREAYLQSCSTNVRATDLVHNVNMYPHSRCWSSTFPNM